MEYVSAFRAGHTCTYARDKCRGVRLIGRTSRKSNFERGREGVGGTCQWCARACVSPRSRHTVALGYFRRTWYKPRWRSSSAPYVCPRLEITITASIATQTGQPVLMTFRRAIRVTRLIASPGENTATHCFLSPLSADECAIFNSIPLLFWPIFYFNFTPSFIRSPLTGVDYPLLSFAFELSDVRITENSKKLLIIHWIPS